MRIAVEGCAHGELEIIYDTIHEVEKHDGKKIDLLICCGDFQSTRNLTDLTCMAVPDKYKDMCSFYKYYSGEKVAPVLTIFIGGNHEASNYLQELPYGGWVAPNIYYMGYAGVVNVAGLRIAGISGIYKGQDWAQGHYEKAPYNNSTIRSVYHTRNLEVFRLKQLSGKIDIFLSHDWPRGITKYGDEKALLKKKPFFQSDINSNALGSPPCMELLEHHYPSYWFAAHLHCKFAAIVTKSDDSTKSTKFLALDKCLPKRKFLQILDIPHDDKLPIKFSYDHEWLAILFLTNHLLSVRSGAHYMPGEGGARDVRWIFMPTELEMQSVLRKFDNNLEIPENFEKTSPAYDPEAVEERVASPSPAYNPQTASFCEKLGIDDPSVLLQLIGNSRDSSLNNSEPERLDFDNFSDWMNMSGEFDEQGVLRSLLELQASASMAPLSPIHKTPEKISDGCCASEAKKEGVARKIDTSTIPDEEVEKVKGTEKEKSKEEEKEAEEEKKIEGKERKAEEKEKKIEKEEKKAEEKEKKVEKEEKKAEEEERMIEEEEKKSKEEERMIEEEKKKPEREEKKDEEGEEKKSEAVNSVAPVDDEIQAILMEPDCKKFKRRNQSLYSDAV